jgi:hypothetical protein
MRDRGWLGKPLTAQSMEFGSDGPSGECGAARNAFQTAGGQKDDADGEASAGEPETALRSSSPIGWRQAARAQVYWAIELGVP